MKLFCCFHWWLCAVFSSVGSLATIVYCACVSCVLDCMSVCHLCLLTVLSNIDYNNTSNTNRCKVQRQQSRLRPSVYTGKEGVSELCEKTSFQTVSLATVCILPTQPRWSYCQTLSAHTASVLTQWLWCMHGIVCCHLAEPCHHRDVVLSHTEDYFRVFPTLPLVSEIHSLLQSLMICTSLHQSLNADLKHSSTEGPISINNHSVTLTVNTAPVCKCRPKTFLYRRSYQYQ